MVVTQIDTQRCMQRRLKHPAVFQPACHGACLSVARPRSDRPGHLGHLGDSVETGERLVPWPVSEVRAVAHGSACTSSHCRMDKEHYASVPRLSSVDAKG